MLLNKWNENWYDKSCDDNVRSSYPFTYIYTCKVGQVHYPKRKLANMLDVWNVTVHLFSGIFQDFCLSRLGTYRVFHWLLKKEIYIVKTRKRS